MIKRANKTQEDKMRSQVETRIDFVNNDSKTDLNDADSKSFKRILVVDDERRFRDIYKSIFRMAGFKVFTAANASDACVILTDEEIDLVILDINIAHEDGAVLFQVIKAYRRNIKVIVSSVYPINEQVKKIEQANGYFDKSDGKDVLLMMVCAFFEDFNKIM